jgi:uncharacterized protein (TIGR02147 family)
VIVDLSPEQGWPAMPDICEYLDYRRFLQDYYEQAKSESGGFSYQTLSERAGIKSKGFLHNVLKGKRNLTNHSVLGLARAMKLGKAETEYFTNLVSYNHATTLAEKNHYYERLLSVRAGGKNAWQPQLVRKEQYEFYSQYHHSVIRSLIDLNGFRGDYEQLARAVRPRITASQARKSVELLLRLGLVEQGPKGAYRLTGKSIATPPQMSEVAVQKFHEQTALLALRSINELPRDRRNVSGLTLGISRKTYQAMCEEIRAFRTKLLRMAEQDNEADSVYQLNFQFFPVSNGTTEGGKE